MADTSFATDHPLAVKMWSKGLAHEAMARTYVFRFMGTGDGNVLQIKEELRKDAGDQVTIGLRMQLSGDGVAGDGALEDNEEALDLRDDAMIIDQLRNAVRSSGKMSEQRINFSVVSEAYDGLADWFAGRIDEAFINQISGNSAATAIRSGSQVPTEPTTGRLLVEGGGAEGTLTSGDIFTTAGIDNAVEKARTIDPMLLRPIKVNGEDKFVMFISEYQRTSLRKDPNWNEVTNSAWQSSRNSHPVYTGSIGEWNGTILHASNRMPLAGGTPNTARSVLCGAQAAWIAYGRGDGPNRYTWVEETFDYGNKIGVAAGCIWGLKKSVFTTEDNVTSIDFGCIVYSTYAAPAT